MATYGIQIPDFSYARDDPAALFPGAVAVAAAAEEAGFSSLWLMDHFHQFAPMGGRTDPMAESYTLLAALAARTERIGLGAMVTGVTYRNPAHLAKIVTTLDVISGGRAWLGIGASWQEDEFRAYGFGDDLPSAGARLDLLEDAIRIAKAMFAGGPATVTGHVASIDGAINVPPPIRPGGPPIMVGGGGERRLLRLVARYADAWNFFGDPASIRHKLTVLDGHCAAVGRDPAEIHRTVLLGVLVDETTAAAGARVRAAAERAGTDPAVLEDFVIAGRPEEVRERCAQYTAAGIDGLIVNTAGPWSPEGVAAAGEVLSGLG